MQGNIGLNLISVIYYDSLWLVLARCHGSLNVGTNRMADKKFPFSSFFKDTKFIQNLGEAAIKAIDSATKVIENATAKLEETAEKNIIKTHDNSPAPSQDSNKSEHHTHSGFLITKGNYGDMICGYQGVNKKIVIPNGIKDIGEFAFQNNQTIEAVVIPNSVWNIGRGAFKNCKSLSFVSLPNNNYFITMPSDLFKGCTSLTSIVWNPNLKLIRRDSIEDCPLSSNTLLFFNKFVYSSKRDAYISKQIAKADEISGYHIDSSSAHFPTSTDQASELSKSKNSLVENSIGKIVSKVLDSFHSITPDKTTPRWDNDLYILDDVLIGIKEGLTELSIPEYIHETEANAFNLGTELIRIIFKGKLRQIGNNCFCGLTNLQSIIFEDDVGEIENNAFKGCTALESVIFKKGLSDIWNNCFQECTSLKEINLPDSCENIGENCFSYCITLKRVHLPANLIMLHTGAFSHCYSLENLIWPKIRIIDKHTYPKISHDVFNNVLNDDNWERFELYDGEFKRIIVPALTDDPDGLFDMMLPGEASIIRRLPQIVMNATLNHAWEHSSSSEHYDSLLTIMKVCFSFAKIFTCMLEDDRVERLFILDDLKYVLLRNESIKENNLPGILPFTIYDTLFALCGKGSLRKYYDNQVLKLICPFVNINPKIIDSIEKDSTFNPPARVSDFIKNVYTELSIGPSQPFRYDIWKTSLTTIIMDNTDFYTFNYYMSSLADSIFHVILQLDIDLSDSDLTDWCFAWNNFLHENYSTDFHIVLFHPYDFETDLQHESECRFVSMLTWEQINALREILRPYGLENIITVFTMELCSDI